MVAPVSAHGRLRCAKYKCSFRNGSIILQRRECPIESRSHLDQYHLTENGRCARCGSPLPESDENCFTCGNFIGFPNVRTASAKEQLYALESRYAVAREKAVHVGVTDEQIMSFERLVAGSRATVNVDHDDLRLFTRNENALYANYQSMVNSQARKPARGMFDRQRLGVEAIVFGTYARRIRYAALSLDGLGCRGYGPFNLVLRDVAVDSRSTVLEENTYSFVKRHALAPGDPLPLGYMCPWHKRGMLAVAKLAGNIKPEMQVCDYGRLLLRSAGDRATEEFMEVHVFGPFDMAAIESVRASRSMQHANICDEEMERVLESGKEWIWE